MSREDLSTNEVAVADLLSGGGEMGSLIRSMDWTKSPVGPIGSWPQTLLTAVSICLGSRHPIALWWGPERTMFYNDAYRPMLGESKHPQFLGGSGRQCWAEIWDIIGPMMDHVIATGEATWSEDLLLLMFRYGYMEETYFTFSYSPIPDGSGRVGGIFNACTESTARVLGERRMRTLRQMAVEARTANEAARICADILANNPHDIPFALVYLLDDAGRSLRLAGQAGMEPGTPASPYTIEMADPDLAGWPLRSVAANGLPEVVEDLTPWFEYLPGEPWGEPAHHAMILPIAHPGRKQPTGVLVLGISPRRAFDDDYQGFFKLVSGHVATAVANARAYEEEKKRAEKLAEIDRAKTLFFSNVSHEFRTPLTLMLGPLEDTLARCDEVLPPEDRQNITVAHRNALRMLRLVNTLLDFSRIEAGRIQAVYEPTDLAAYTAELASVFRSAIEKAGLRLVVDCPPFPESVFIDREMWEKIVLNLLSNAFKFTFEGQIKVALRWMGDRVDLSVSDTGAGIPEADLSRIFERFHRVRSTRSRSHEGTGIGLALVQELARLHGGVAAVESTEAGGSTFTISIPTGSEHLPAGCIGAGHDLVSTAAGAAPYVEEALGWLLDETGKAFSPSAASAHRSAASGSVASSAENRVARILLADDNADMRDYLRRLLEDYYVVEAVADGEAALSAARERPPDLVLTDIMMPRLDGFGLLKELRADPQTKTTPVILLSARAGEEARVEGLEKGADDYLTKPFSTRELMARVSAHLELARARKKVEEELRRGREELETQVQERTAQLRRQRKWLQVTLSSIGDAVMSTDTAGRITFMNPVAVSMTGWQLEEALGLPGQDVLRIIDEQTDEPVGNIIERVLREECIIALANHSALVTRDGRKIPIEDSAAPIKDREGNLTGVVLVFHDVTERRRAREALSESEERLRLAIDSARLGTWDFDPRTGVLNWSDRCKEIHGLPAEAHVDHQTFLDRLHPDDRQRLDAIIKRAINPSGDGELETEYRVVWQDGTERWIFAKGKAFFNEAEGKRYVVRFTGTVLDISERKRMMEQVESLARFPNENPNPVVRISRDGNLLYANGSSSFLLESLGWELDRELPAEWKELTQKILEGGSWKEIEVPCGGKTFSLMIVPIIGAGYLNVYGRDITGRKRMEVERETTVEFLHLVNQSSQTADLVRTAATFFQEKSGCEAVGIRLMQGDDYPYYETRGFPEEFILLENSLCARDAAGNILRDSAGDPYIECMCGNVICGRVDPSRPFFSPGGSFWANSTTRLLATTSDAERQTKTRNRCNGEGYESVALIPLIFGTERMGLLQLNDRRKGMFTPELIAQWERLTGYLAVALAKTKADEKIQHQNAILETINKIFYQALTCETEEELGIACLTAAEALTQSKFGFIDEIGPDGLLHSFAISNPGWELCTMYDKSGHRRPPGNLEIHGLFDRVLLDGMGLLTNDPYPHPDSIGVPSGHPVLTAFIGVPLFQDGKIIGVVGLGNREGGYGSEHLQAVEAIAPAMVQVLFRKRAEEALRKAHDELESRVRQRTAELAAANENLREQAALLDLAHDAILVRGLDGKIRYWNDGAEKTYGWTRNEALGKSAHTLFHSHFPKPLDDLMADLLRDGEWEGELSHKTKSGERIIVASRWALQRGPEGSPIGMLEINRDISQRKRAEEQVKSYTAKLEESNRALQDFAFIASHDLQEPLRKVSAFGNMLKQKCGGSLDEQGGDYLERMLNANQRMQSLLTALLEYARLSTRADPFVEIDLSKIVHEVLSDLEVKIKKTGGEVSVGELPVIQADPTQMRQLFQNLIGNALKFYETGKKPIVRVRSISNTGSECQIVVEDSGIGFDERYLEKIFAPFQRLHGRSSQYEGTGMGLAICKKIVERHGGSITAKSVPGEGTAFIITLPLRIQSRS